MNKIITRRDLAASAAAMEQGLINAWVDQESQNDPTLRQRMYASNLNLWFQQIKPESMVFTPS